MKTADVRRRDASTERRTLMLGGKLRCPHDKQLRDILEYRAFDRNEEFADELAVILKCPCGHIFAPIASQEELRKAIQEIRSV